METQQHREELSMQMEQKFMIDFSILKNLLTEDIFVFSTGEAMYHGLKKPSKKTFEINSDNMIPNEINAFEKRRDCAVMGFGSTPLYALSDAKSKIKNKLKKRKWDIIQLNNGVLLQNGANIQYMLSGRLLKKFS